MANSYSAPNMIIDTSGNLSAIETALSHTLVTADVVFVINGATLAVDVSRTCLIYKLGETSTGDPGAGNRRGNLTFNSSITQTFDGNATSTNSGIKSSPTATGTETKSSTLTIGSGCIFTNATGAYDANGLWQINMTWGVYGACPSFTMKYSAGSTGVILRVPGPTANTVSTSHEIGNVTYWPGVASNGAVMNIISATSLALPVNLGFLIMDLTGSVTYNLIMQPIATASIGTQYVTCKGMSVQNTPAGRMGVIQAGGNSPTAGQMFSSAFKFGPTVTQAVTTVPTGLTLTNPGTGGVLTSTISNTSAYSNTDLFQLAQSDGTIVGEFTKADYAAAGYGTTWNVLTNGVSYQLKIRVTSDNFVFSDYSALCTAETPTGTSPCTTPTGFALTDAETDGELTWVITNYSSLEAGARLVFYNGATVLDVQPAAAAGRFAGLTNGTAYTLTVCADAAGYSESTASSSSTATPTAPSTVTVSSAELFMDPNVDMDLAMFGENITYTPQGVAVRTIKAVVCRETYQDLFDTGTDTIKYERMEIVVSARNNTTGIVAPTECGKTGGGDSLVLEGKTWYVHQINERNVAGTHRMLISTAQTPPNWS